MTLVAVLGGGQLGRMLALAGLPLGLRFRFLDPDPQCPAADVGAMVVGAYDDPESLRRLVAGASVVTFEFENVPHAAAEWLEQESGVPVRPRARALALGQDRLLEKELLRECGMSLAPYEPVQDEESARRAAERIGFPAVLKTRRLGYDGKGQVVLRGAGAGVGYGRGGAGEAEGGSGAGGGDAVVQAWKDLGRLGCVLERLVPFQREVSVLAARAVDGSVVVYPPVENVHRNGILHRSRAVLEQDAAGRAAEHARRLLEALDYVGLLCIEFFEVDGVLLANEYAPRVHNSGHWTIEGAECSQFENHLRAILGLPLGSTALRGHAGMVNLVGTAPELNRLLAIPGANVHLYGKAPRPGRKLGHVTVVAGSAEGLDLALSRVEAVVG